MYYWTPKRIKELNERGYKLQFCSSTEQPSNETKQESECKQDKVKSEHPELSSAQD
jgi:hypothetical protein